MKKQLSLIIVFLIILLAVPVSAANSYITLDPYPYSIHVLGEDLVIYGDTDFSQVIIGLYYPNENGYNGTMKYSMIISKEELRTGHVIGIGEASREWPEGDWKIRVQNGKVWDEMYITMSQAPVYDQVLKVVEYEDSALSKITSYHTRGVIYKDNVLTFNLEDNTLVKIYCWNDLEPTDSGEGVVYIAKYEDDILTQVKSYSGYISSFGYHISLKIDENKRVKLLYWNDNLTPVK